MVTMGLFDNGATIRERWIDVDTDRLGNLSLICAHGIKQKKKKRIFNEGNVTPCININAGTVYCQ